MALLWIASQKWMVADINEYHSLSLSSFSEKNEGKRYSKAPSDTLRERKEAYMHPKSADEVFVRVPDSLSEVTKGIMSPMNARQHPRETKSGGKRFPRVQAALLRSKRGRKCYRRDSEQA